MLPQGAAGVFHHGGVEFVHPLQGHVGLAHEEEGFQDVFLHIDGGVVFPRENLFQGREFVLPGNAAHHGQGLDAVVIRALVPGRPVTGSVPAGGVEPPGDVLHHVFQQDHVGRSVEHVGEGQLSFQGQVVPQDSLGIPILVFAGIGPVPVTLAVKRHAVFVQLPGLQEIAAHPVINRRHKGRITAVPIILMETVPAHGGQHLHGKFRYVIAGRDGSVEGAIGLLPVDQLVNTLAGQGPRGGAQGVKSHSQLVHLIAPPLGAFAVGAVVIRVPHAHHQGAGRFLPVRIQEGVVAGEGTGKLRVVRSLAVAHFQHFHPFGDVIEHLLPVHPAEMLVFLYALAGNVFRAHALLFSHGQVVGVDANHLSRRRFNFQPGREVPVVGEGADQRSVLHLGLFVGAASVVFPLGNGTFYQGAQGRLSGGETQFHRTSEPFGVLAQIPVKGIGAGIEADIAFRQTVIGNGTGSGLVAVLDAGFPGFVRKNFYAISDGFEEQGCHAAVQVAEAVAAQVPDQNGNQIFARAQPRGDIHRIYIAVAGGGTAFQTAFIDSQFAVDPQPVFGVGRNAGGQALGNLVQVNPLAEGNPFVGAAVALLLGNPSGPPDGFLRQGEETGTEGQNQE